MGLAGVETVLVVDDDPVILDMISEMLTPLGIKTHVAVNCTDALDVAAQTQKIDMLLTDVVMPDMLGQDLALRFKDKCPDAKILFMSGLLCPSSAQNDANPDENLFIQKPFTADDLILKLKEIFS